MNLKTRIDKAEAEANARKQAEQDAIVTEMMAWRGRCISASDEDSYARWLTTGHPETETSKSLRAAYGEFVQWRDWLPAARIYFLTPLDLMARVFQWDEGFTEYCFARRLYHALKRFDVLRELGHLPEGAAVKAVTDVFYSWPLHVQEIDRRAVFHGLKWEAIESYFPDVSRAEFETLAAKFDAPTDDELQELFAYEGREITDDLAERLADELHAMGT